ncbi:MAG: hypothetical protein AAF587_26060 [Bacteroidota bacterium]
MSCISICAFIHIFASCTPIELPGPAVAAEDAQSGERIEEVDPPDPLLPLVDTLRVTVSGGSADN